MTVHRRITLAILTVVLAATSLATIAGPAQAGVFEDFAASPGGDVTYREYWVPHSEFTGDCSSATGGSWFLEPNDGTGTGGPCTKSVDVTLDDPSGATRAELFLDLWRNRNTPAMRVKVNGGSFINTTKGADWARTPEVMDISGETLNTGVNTLEFKASVPVHLHDAAIRLYGVGTPPAASITTVGGIAAGTGGTINLDAASDSIDVVVDVTTLDAGANPRFLEVHAFYSGLDEDNSGEGNTVADWHALSQNNTNPGGTSQGGGPVQADGPATHHVGSVALTGTGSQTITWDDTSPFPLDLVRAQNGVRFKVRVVDGEGDVFDGDVSAQFDFTRPLSQVLWVRPDSFSDTGLHIGGGQTQQKIFNYTLNGVNNLNNVSSATLIGNYWGSPLVSFNQQPDLLANSNNNNIWDLGQVDVPLDDLQVGQNQARFRYNAAETLFGDFVEDPAPVLVMRRDDADGDTRATPIITAHPADVTLKASDGPTKSVTFTAGAVGDGIAPPGTCNGVKCYQWQVNGAPVGPADDEFSRTKQQLADGDQITVVVTDVDGDSVTSRPATVFIEPDGTSPDLSGAAWHNTSFDKRLHVQVYGNGHDRVTERIVERSIDFTALTGVTAAPGSGSNVQLVEVDPGTGNVLDSTVDAQLDGTGGTKTLIWWLEANGNSPLLGQNEERHYHLYFNADGTGTGTTPTTRVAINQSASDEGQSAFQITTDSGTWFLQDDAGAFSSLVDTDGNDWLGYSSAPGVDGVFRGYPNVSSLSESDSVDVFHPGETGVTTTVISQGPLKSVVESTVDVRAKDGVGDATWTYRSQIYPTHIRSEIVAYDGTDPNKGFWWQYEGVPGGTLTNDDKINRNEFSDGDPLDGDGARGTATQNNQEWNEDIRSDEWAFLADQGLDRSFFLAQEGDDGHTDLFREVTAADTGTGADTGSMLNLGLGRLRRNNLNNAEGLFPFVQGNPGGGEVLPVFHAGLMETSANAGGLNTIAGLVRPLVTAQAADAEDAPPDTTPPTLSNVVATGGNQSITVTWDTNEAANSNVDYGPTTSYGSTESEAPFVTSHSVTITGLACGTTYQLRARSVDGSSNTGTSTNRSATTSACPSANDGYWVMSQNGTVYEFGVANRGSGGGESIDIDATSDGEGYWILRSDGTVVARNAPNHGNISRAGFAAGERLTSLSPTPDDGGYWAFTNKGRVIQKGNAQRYPLNGQAGQPTDLTPFPLQGDIISSISTPDGKGYYMIGSDGGVFTFGNAKFHGSTGDQVLNKPVVGIVPDPDGVGYWLVSSDGGIFTFKSVFRGSLGNVTLQQPIVGAIAYGNGYMMFARDGGVFLSNTINGKNFKFSDKAFKGSVQSRLGGPAPSPVVAATVTD